MMLLTIMLLTACGFAVTSQGDPLYRSTWQLQTIDSARIIDGTEISVVFRDGQINGRAGCNNYYGSVGAFIGRYFFFKKYGPMWRQYAPVLLAGFSCGMGLSVV